MLWYDYLVINIASERISLMPRCVPYTLISIAAIIAISALSLPDLLMASVVLVHGAVLLLDPGSLDFSFGEDRKRHRSF